MVIMENQTYIPEITGMTLQPNPATIRQTVTISVDIVDVLHSDLAYIGELYIDEQIGVI